MSMWKRCSIAGIVLLTLIVSSWYQVTASKPYKGPLRSRNDVLSAIPHRSDVLINIHRRLFPATWDLTLLGQKATPALRRGLLGNTKGYVRWKCAQVLTQLRDASARPTLHRALSDWNASVRAQVLQALSELGNKKSVPFILKRFQDPQETQRNKVLALQALGKLGDVRGIKAIIQQYDAYPKSSDVRYAAVQALWELRQVVPRKTMTTFMRRALKDKAAYVVRRAVIASGVLKDKGAVSTITKLLAHKAKSVRNIAAYVLGEIGDASALPALVKSLQFVRTGRFLNNITFSLQRLGDPQLMKRLTGFLRHRQAFIRLNAAFAVGEMRVNAARSILEQALQDPNMIVRNQAIIALAKLGDKRSLPALKKTFSQDSGLRKQLARLALLFITNGQAYRDLLWKELHQSRSRTVRKKSGFLLASLGDQRAAPFLYHQLRYTTSKRAWRLGQSMKSPYLRKLIELDTARQIKQQRTYRLPQLLRFVGKEKVKQHKKELLSLLIRKWYRPNKRSRHVYKKYRPGTPSRLWGYNRRNRQLEAVMRQLGGTHDRTLALWLQGFLYHRSYHIRTEALLALAMLGDNGALRSLVARLVNASDRHRPYLVRRLSALSVKRLKQAFRSQRLRKDPFLQLALSTALLRAGDKRALKTLLSALRRPQYAVRMRAYAYLKHSVDASLRKTLRGLYDKEQNEHAKSLLRKLIKDPSKRIPEFSFFYVNDVTLD
ncbi:MAG: hypothetical protein CL920_08265 [Deltaproteobacteria bacterium]|nr:hypothetical protein [Deltaproteobacteria bacterium]MBU48674.1 hypothetical protein [Deltaproteobacteria bacterium]